MSGSSGSSRGGSSSSSSGSTTQKTRYMKKGHFKFQSGLYLLLLSVQSNCLLTVNFVSVKFSRYSFAYFSFLCQFSLRGIVPVRICPSEYLLMEAEKQTLSIIAMSMMLPDELNISHYKNVFDPVNLNRKKSCVFIV